jgi:uncharacterized DUF497 family protein
MSKSERILTASYTHRDPVAQIIGSRTANARERHEDAPRHDVANVILRI